MDVRAQPLIAQQGNIRVEPFATPPVPSVKLPPSVERTLGHGGLGGGVPTDQVDLGIDRSEDPASALKGLDDNGDGVFDEHDVAHLQQAAASGDKESVDLLKALGIPLLAAAGGYAALRGGLSLVDVVGKAKGMEMVNSGRTGGVHAPQAPPVILPNPVKAITDQTGSRFEQPAPEHSKLPQLTDQRSIYEKIGGKLPTGSAAGEALRAAARAVRR